MLFDMMEKDVWDMSKRNLVKSIWKKKLDAEEKSIFLLKKENCFVWNCGLGWKQEKFKKYTC